MDAEAPQVSAAPPPEPDPFPHDAAGQIIRRVPTYARLAWAVARDPSLSRVRRAAVLGAAAYLVSPIDAIPALVPVAGQLDDLLVVMAALRFALNGLSPERRRAHLAQVGMTESDIVDDLRAMRGIGAWVMHRGQRRLAAATERFGRTGDRDLDSLVDEARRLPVAGSSVVGWLKGALVAARGSEPDGEDRRV